MSKNLIYLLHLGRPLFLLGGLIFHFLGITIAIYRGATLSVPAVVWGQVAITAIQIMTHYSNDYFDLSADIANTTPTRWSGGSRILVQEKLRPEVALNVAIIFMVIAAAAILVLILVVHPSSTSIVLLVLGLILAWEYSSPPLRLHSRGLGEVTVGLIVPVLTPLVGYSLQAGQTDLLPVLAVFPLFCLQIAMVLTINIPDAVSDRQTGKQTLVTRLGPEEAMRLYIVLIALAYLSIPYLVFVVLPVPVAVAYLLPLPLALIQIIRIRRGAASHPDHWNSLAFWSIALLMISAVLVILAFLWLILQ